MANRFLYIFIFIFSILNANVLKSVKVEDNLVKLEFLKSLTKKDIKASAIKGKDLTRYVFDFKNSILSAKAKKRFDLKGSIKSIRVAQHNKNSVRLVIDSKKPYPIRFYQKDKPIFYIVLPESSEVIKENKKLNTKELFSKVKEESKSKVTKAKVIPTNYSTGLKKRYTIIIDPGHGGKDSGTHWSGYKEKTLVLSIAKKVARRLKNLGFKVRLTRYNDRYISLGKRVRVADRNRADLFVSIHANSIKYASRAKKARGVQTYYFNNDKRVTRSARRVAAAENMSLLKSAEGASSKALLEAVVNGPKRLLSQKLAHDVQNGILRNTRSQFKYVKNGGVRGAPFLVLVGVKMPAILVEVGYLSNPMERKRLFNPKYQDLIAKGIVEGIVRYLKNKEREEF